MREANGNAAAGLSLSVFLLVATIIGPLVLNVMVLMPQTRANQEIVNEVEQYKDILTRSQPLLQAAVSNKAQREQAIAGRLAAFRDAEVVTSQLRKFLSDLEAAGAEITDEASRTVVNSNLGVSGLVGKTITVKMRSDFLRYLLVRNKFVRSQSSVTVSNETVTSLIGDPVMTIEVTMIVPARS
jgi:ribosomal protein S17